MIEAINSAMDVAMARDDRVVVFGEDVGYFGGVFRATAGLQKKYGKTRAFDTPITECGIIGVAVGMAAYGLRPVPEIQFADYIYPAFDQLVERGGAHPLSLCRAMDDAHHRPLSLWRRHFRRADAQPVSRRHFHACRGPEDRHPLHAL
jgi:deoxyxylulose-5-phosphate synthase